MRTKEKLLDNVPFGIVIGKKEYWSHPEIMTQCEIEVFPLDDHPGEFGIISVASVGLPAKNTEDSAPKATWSFFVLCQNRIYDVTVDYWYDKPQLKMVTPLPVDFKLPPDSRLVLRSEFGKWSRRKTPAITKPRKPGPWFKFHPTE